MEGSLAGRGEERLELPSSSILGMEGHVEKAGSVREAYFIGERFGCGDGGAIYTVGGFEKELGEIRGGMPSCLQAVEEEGGKALEISFVRILPEISMERPVDESVEDTRGLCGRGGPVQV